ncbi:MAG: hypothetical protein ACJ8F7_06350 [Gemmataceae bacterium]
MQRLTVRPIEDPAEQAALDERLKRAEMQLREAEAIESAASNTPRRPKRKRGR